MFSRMHRFNVNILFNLNKDLIFVNSVSLLHMYRLHHPRYLNKLCKKKAPSDWNISVRICSTIFTPLDKLFCIFIASTTAHSWPSPTLSDVQCIFFLMRVPQNSLLQFSTSRIFNFWDLIPNSNRDWLYYAGHGAQDNSRCINWHLWKERGLRFPFYSWCITLTGMIGCRAAAEAGRTDTFNAVPLYLVQN